MSLLNINHPPSEAREALIINPHEIEGQESLVRSRFVGETILSGRNPEQRALDIREDLLKRLEHDPAKSTEIQKFKGYDYSLIEDKTISEGSIIAVRPVCYIEDGKFKYLDLPIQGREFGTNTIDNFAGVVESKEDNIISGEYGIDPHAIWVFRAGNFLPLRLKRHSREGIYIPHKEAFDKINKRDLKGCISIWSTIDEMGKDAPMEAWRRLDQYANRLTTDNPGLKTELRR